MENGKLITFKFFAAVCASMPPTQLPEQSNSPSLETASKCIESRDS